MNADKVVLVELKRRFLPFLENVYKTNPLKGEYFLPFVVDELLQEKKAEVTVLRSYDNWYGVTYKEDKENVMETMVPCGSPVQVAPSSSVYSACPPWFSILVRS